MGIGQWVAFSRVSQGPALLWFGGKLEGQMLGISGSWQMSPVEDRKIASKLF